MEDRSKIHVAHTSLHACVRAHKLALPFSDLGHKVAIVAENLVGNSHPWWAYDLAALLWRGGEQEGRLQFQRTIRNLDPWVDVWHVHNEPDWPVSVIRKLSEKPIIYDIHDLKSQRKGAPDEVEDLAVEAANGFSVVSRRYLDLIVSRAPQKPVFEILSGVPREWLPKEKLPLQRRGIVYEGGLASPGIMEFPCRDWSQVFESLHRDGIQTWVYVGNPSVDRKYYPKTIVQGPYEYLTLLKELTQYEVGLIGSPVPDPMFDGAMPNKLFEYMAAGLPMICMNAPDVTNFLAATGMGITVSSAAEIPEAIEKIRSSDMAEIVWENRKYWVQETQQDKLCSLYERVLGREIVHPPLGRNIEQMGGRL